MEKLKGFMELYLLKHSEENQQFINKIIVDDICMYLHCRFDPTWEDLEKIKEWGSGYLAVENGKEAPIVVIGLDIPKDEGLESKSLPKVITLCGSTKFKEKYNEANRKFTKAGLIVLAPAHFHHGGDGPLTEEQKIKLDELHLRKIDISDYVYVLNVEGYVGDSTKKEIQYAKSKGIKIVYYSKKQSPLHESKGTKS